MDVILIIFYVKQPVLFVTRVQICLKCICEMQKLQQCEYVSSLITEQSDIGHSISLKEAADDNRKDVNI